MRLLIWEHQRAFNTDWSYAAGNIAIIAIIPLLIYFYIPFFRKLDVTTAYEYLEERFGITMRVIGSLAFTLFHIGRVAIVIYLPTLAITSVSDINPYLIAALVGLLCVIYTFMGGIEGVIWSDVIQGIILLGGAVAVIFLGAFQIDGNFGTVLNEAVQDKKFVSMDNWKFGTAAAAIQLYLLVLSLITYTNTLPAKISFNVIKQLVQYHQQTNHYGLTGY